MYDDTEGASAVEEVGRWLGSVRLLQRAVAIARMAGATTAELSAIAEGEGFSSTEFAELLVDEVAR